MVNLQAGIGGHRMVCRDPGGGMVVQGAVPVRTGRHSTKVVIAVALLSLAVVTTTLLVRDRGTVPKKKSQVVIGLFGGSPLGGGSRMSLAEAVAAFPLPVFRPNVPIASDATMSGLWVRVEGDAEVYIKYDSDIIVTLRPARTTQSTQSFAVAQINDGVPGEIEKVAGIDAFVVPGSDEGDLGSVRFALGREMVTVIGNGSFDSATLLEVAESIPATAADVESVNA
jgi:hypothetical protein